MSGETPSTLPMRGLSWRLALWVLGFSLAVSALESGYTLYAQYGEFLEQNENDLTQIGEVSLGGLANALWNMDSKTLGLLLDGLRQMPGVELAQVSEEGRLLAFSGQAVSARRLERDYPLVYPVRGEARPVGQLKVVLGLDKGLDRLRREAITGAIMATGRTLVLASAMLLLFYSLVARPLRRMSQYAASLTFDGLDVPLSLGRASRGGSGPDELDQLAQALETMRLNLASSADGLRRANESLRQEVALRLEAEKDLHSARALLRAMLDSMPSVVIALSADLRVTHLNAMAASFGGVDKEQALGLSLQAAFPMLAQCRPLLEAALRGRTPVLRQRLRLDSGRGAISAELVVYPLGDQDGAVLRLDDQTRRDAMEEALIQSEKMASLGSLAAGMAHEINNPLAGVLQNAQSLQRRLSVGLPANEQAARQSGFTLEALENYLGLRNVPALLEGVRQSGERAARIVGNMLKFARKSPQGHEPHSLAEIVEAALELAQTDYDMKKKYDFRRIRIERHIDPALPPVPCSPQEIEQVVLNLFKNAAQAMTLSAMDEREPVITLRLTSQERFVVLTVSDNGPGMDEATRRRVFEPFFTTKGQGEGTGLGLSVSYYIVTQNHGGSIEASSVQGQGASFTVRLPLTRKAASAPGAR